MLLSNEADYFLDAYMIVIEVNSMVKIDTSTAVERGKNNPAYSPRQ